MAGARRVHVVETKIEEARGDMAGRRTDREIGSGHTTVQQASGGGVVGVSSQAWLKSISSNSYMHRNGDGL